MGDPEQFQGKSARSPLKILRCAQDDSVGAWIGVILKGAAVWLHGKSARGPMKILRCAQDDSVGAWIGVILKGAAVRLHARSARRWDSLGSCPKGVVFRHRGPVFYGVVPERGLFRAQV